MSTYHKIKNAIDSYLEQESASDKYAEQLDLLNECFMGDKVGTDKERIALENNLKHSEKALSFALKNLTEIVPSDVCPIALINDYTENKAKTMERFL